MAGKPLLSFSTSGASLPWLDEQGQVLSLKDIFDDIVPKKVLAQLYLKKKEYLHQK